jgi:hypothetical protein
MSTFERRRSGYSRNEPRRDADILTPQKLAQMIADQVTIGLEKTKDELWAAVQQSINSAANLMIPKLAKAAAADATEQITGAAKRSVKAIENAALRADRLYDELGALVKRGSENTEERLTEWEHKQNKILYQAQSELREAFNKLSAAQSQIVGKIRSASVETLTEIIGREVANQELQSMIRAEVAAAVRQAMRELNSPAVKDSA